MVGTHFMRNSVVLAVLMIAAAAGYLAYGPTPAFANQCTPGQQCADGVGCRDGFREGGGSQRDHCHVSVINGRRPGDLSRHARRRAGRPPDRGPRE